MWFVFWSLKQTDGEPIDNFMKRPRTQAKKCQFIELLEIMLLCRVMFDISNKPLQEKLLRNNNVSLPFAIDVIRASTRVFLAP